MFQLLGTDMHDQRAVNHYIDKSNLAIARCTKLSNGDQKTVQIP